MGMGLRLVGRWELVWGLSEAEAPSQAVKLQWVFFPHSVKPDPEAYICPKAWEEMVDSLFISFLFLSHCNETTMRKDMGREIKEEPSAFPKDTC